ncbi:hypothetical protein VP01_1910g3 [Puccinia sorghi]|uniref:Uncharacterized protein n=1 Tax=Puccinia sorghi TaxID=27349 RepID=A0A0L6VCR4_9BASI|nr:hypothetical protein VP01_1910g3 [Puccinia sorghi]
MADHTFISLFYGPDQSYPTSKAITFRGGSPFTNICKIQAQNLPCKQLTGSHEIPLFIKPNNNKEFIRITVDWVTLWTREMVRPKNPVITTLNPPNSLAFTFETRAEARNPEADCQTSTPEGISTNPQDIPTSATVIC